MKLFKYDKPEEPICYFGTNKQIEIKDLNVRKDVYGLWVSNVVNIDMPSLKDIEIYKNKVKEIVKTCQSYHINTIFFQVRTTNDAFYPSKINPSSRYLMEEEGRKMPFDVFEYMINQAKNASLSVHAWLNPYRVSMKSDLSKDEYLKTCDDLNFAKKHPDLLVTDKKGQFILNPASEKVKKHILNTIDEILNHYDIDGIHFDDYFYPYGGLSDDNDDTLLFEQRDDKNQSIGDFRRMHVTDIVRRTYKLIKSHHTTLQFGISPFGIWKNKTKDNHGSHTSIKASQSYSNEYADSYHWVKEGIIDYICPQIYWQFAHELAPFADLVDFWVDAVKDTNVDLYIGHAPYRLGQEGDFKNPMEIVNQLMYCEQYDEIKGHVFFTYHTFIDEGPTQEGMAHLRNYLTKEYRK